ncbi:glutamate decarboxylase [Devriesea agamarum]|uniref:glutamate decarboxylase n=1 Tax=Devriesea agamarum TaxID=472569 RepID=UPI00071C8627|nr:glutamate decarboxylase [Devriesea agamarum]
MDSAIPDHTADVFAARTMREPSPSTQFPENPRPSREAYQLVHDELYLDGVARMNLATFCTTWVDDETRKLMDESLTKNIIDKDEYPQTSELEARCIRMLADLLHVPDAEHAVGTSTTGSSEAAMLGGLAAKWRWRAKRRAEGKDTTRPNLVCGPVQVCWEKFATYFDVELRELPMPEGYVMTPEMAADACDENTIAVVATFGQTFTGLFEDVAGICQALDELQERTGLDVPVHVDAASGGFVAAFTAPQIPWDFRQERVKSMNLSGHKTGLAPLGAGWALWRSRDDLPRELVFEVNYLGGMMPTFNLNFSRPGGQVVASYYSFIHLGRRGYTNVQGACYEVGQLLAREIEGMGPFELIFDADPQRGIPAVTWKLKDPDCGLNLFRLADELRCRGWLVPAYTLPPAQDKQAVQRLVIRHGFSVDMAQMLLKDLRSSLDRLQLISGSNLDQVPDESSFHHDAHRLTHSSHSKTAT